MPRTRALAFAAIVALTPCIARAGNLVAADGKAFDEYLLYQEAYGFSAAITSPWRRVTASRTARVEHALRTAHA